MQPASPNEYYRQRTYANEQRHETHPCKPHPADARFAGVIPLSYPARVGRRLAALSHPRVLLPGALRQFLRGDGAARDGGLPGRDEMDGLQPLRRLDHDHRHLQSVHLRRDVGSGQGAAGPEEEGVSRRAGVGAGTEPDRHAEPRVSGPAPAALRGGEKPRRSSANWSAPANRKPAS